MVESEQERKGKVRALATEIDQARAQIKYLRGRVSDLENVEGYEAQVAMMRRDIDSYERVLEVAADELILRTGGQPQLKRGPGRPRKNP